MKLLPVHMLMILNVLLCVLCGWQWHRERLLRQITVEQSATITALQGALAESEQRNKTSNTEILQLTGVVAELRAQSDSVGELAALKVSHEEMKQLVQTQSARLGEQNDSLTKADASVRTANDSIRQLIKERDSLAEKLNSLTLKYNKLGNR